MKSSAKYRKRWREGLLLGYMVNFIDPSFPRRYTKAMMKEDRRQYWAKKRRTLGPSYNRTIEVYLGKQRRKQMIDQYYNRSLINMWPTCIICVDLVRKTVTLKHHASFDNRLLYEKYLKDSDLDEKE